MDHNKRLENQDTLISILGACVLLRNHSPGPACDKIADDLMNTIVELRAQKRLLNDENAIKDMSKGHLIHLREFFQFHADENTDGIGADTFETLNNWGAFSGPRTLHLKPSDQEINTFIFLKNLRALKDIDERKASEFIKSSTSYVTDDNEILRGFITVKSLIIFKDRRATDEQLLQSYKELGIDRAKGRIARTLIEVFGRKARLANKLAAPAPKAKPSQKFKK